MASTYINPYQYLRQPTGLSLAVVPNYIGNLFRLTSANAAGVTSLTVPNTAAQTPLNAFDNLYIFDGPNSEIVQVASITVNGSTTIPLIAATQYAHSSGVVVCSDGPSGSLGEQIFTASQWIEDDICFQALWSVTYTGEKLTLPTMRAALDNQGNLHFRPRHFPITALTSVTIQTNAFNAVAYDPTQAIIDSDQQTVDLAPLAVLATQSSSQITQSSPWLWGVFGRATTAWVTLTYTSGFAVNALPYPIVRACALLTSECFSQLENPVGADSIQQNKRNVTFVVRGEISGESLLVKQAQKLLAKYIAQSF